MLSDHDLANVGDELENRRRMDEDFAILSVVSSLPARNLTIFEIDDEINGDIRVDIRLDEQRLEGATNLIFIGLRSQRIKLLERNFGVLDT